MENPEVRLIRINVVYARALGAKILELRLPAGSSLLDAVTASGLVEPGQWARLAFGVFGELRTPATLLADGDRVEIYRELTIDPKEARRLRAAARRGAIKNKSAR